MGTLRYVASGEAIVSERELERLHKKAMAHDQYVAAALAMGRLQDRYIRLRRYERVIATCPTCGSGRSPDRYAEGWLDCLRDFNERVLLATRIGP